MSDTLRTRMGRAFAEQRKTLGLSQSTVAQRSDVSVNYLSDIERGAANPTLEALERIAQVLEWDPHTFFSREPSMSDDTHRELVARISDLKDRLSALEGRVGDLAPARTQTSTLAEPWSVERE